MSSVDSARPLWRSRWAAIGAAVAVTLGGGGLFAVQASSSGPSSVVTIDPVRILDTREDLGLAGPFERGTFRTLQVTGIVPTATGDEPVVPEDSTGVLINLTASCVNGPDVACEPGWVAVRPGDATGQSSTSSLNFVSGEQVANSVQVALAADGTVGIVYGPYGDDGQVHLVIDVVGYLTPTTGGVPGPQGPQGEPGPQGEQGEQGEQGPPGPSSGETFSITLAKGDSQVIAEAGDLSVVADCSGTNTRARLLAVTATDDTVVMDGADFRGTPPGNVVTTATPADDREMLATADTGGAVVARSGAGSAFVTNASGDYIGIDNSAALGVNYPNPGECTFRGSAITIEAP